MRKYHAFSAKMSFVTSKPSVRRYLMKNTAVDIELYTDKKDPGLEKKLQELLTAAGIVYEKNEG